MVAFSASQARRIAQREALVADLRARLGQNHSKPPLRIPRIVVADNFPKSTRESTHYCVLPRHHPPSPLLG